MLDSTSPFKVENTERYGAEVVFCGDDALGRQPGAEFLLQVDQAPSLLPQGNTGDEVFG